MKRAQARRCENCGQLETLGPDGWVTVRTGTEGTCDEHRWLRGENVEHRPNPAARESR